MELQILAVVAVVDMEVLLVQAAPAALALSLSVYLTT
jgi:hypothetical protein